MTDQLCCCGAKATGRMSDGSYRCCATCAFHPEGCRCKYGDPPDTVDGIRIHEDSLVGQTQSDCKVEQVSNGLGGVCWKATCTIESILGSSIDGPDLCGIGRTESEAKERLKAELKRFNESLWI